MTRHETPLFRKLTLPLFCAFAVAMLAYLFEAGGGSLPGQSHRQVQAVVPSAVALTQGAAVRMAGVDVGRVTEIAPRGDETLLIMDVDESQAPVYRDARVSVRLKSLVGENYVAVEPGSPRAGTLAENEVLRSANADESTELDEVLGALEPRTRRRLGVTLAELGTSLRGRGDDVNRMVGAASTLTRDASALGQVLRRQRQEVASLVDDVGQVSRSLGDRTTAIRVLARRGNVVAREVAAHDAALRSALRALPPTLQQTASTTAALGALSPSATALLADLTPALRRLTPTVPRLRSAATVTREALAELARFARPAPALLNAACSFSRGVARTVPGLDAALAQLNPIVAYLRPRRGDIVAFFANTRSATDQKVGKGQVARVLGVVSPKGDNFAGLSAAGKQAVDALLAVGGLQEAGNLGSNPYPQAGELLTPTPKSSGHPEVRALEPISAAAVGQVPDACSS